MLSTWYQSYFYNINGNEISVIITRTQIVSFARIVFLIRLPISLTAVIREMFQHFFDSRGEKYCNTHH